MSEPSLRLSPTIWRCEDYPPNDSRCSLYLVLLEGGTSPPSETHEQFTCVKRAIGLLSTVPDLSEVGARTSGDQLRFSQALPTTSQPPTTLHVHKKWSRSFIFSNNRAWHLPRLAARVFSQFHSSGHDVHPSKRDTSQECVVPCPGRQDNTSSMLSVSSL